MIKGALGLYDSGIGGKTVLNEIRSLFPNIEIHYLADTKNLPLGNKSTNEIKKITQMGVEFLFKKGCSIVIIACNTASVNSIRYLQQEWLNNNYPNKKLLGVSIPLLELLNEKYKFLKNKKGLILSTPSTHKANFYTTILKKLGFKNLISVPCPDLAETIETGDKTKIKNKIYKLFSRYNHSNDCNFVILACTHYPLAIKQFRQVFQNNMIFIDLSKTTAKKFKEYLIKHKEYILKSGKIHFWKT